jgi:hypothetical protein
MNAHCRDCGETFEQRDPFVLLCKPCQDEIARKLDTPRERFRSQDCPEAHDTLSKCVRNMYEAVELLDSSIKRQMAVEDAWDALRHVMGWTGRPWEPWSHYDVAVLEEEPAP